MSYTVAPSLFEKEHPLLHLILIEAPFDRIREFVSTNPRSLFEFDFEHMDALFLACRQGNLTLVDYLVSKRSDWSFKTLFRRLTDLSVEEQTTKLIQKEVVYSNLFKILLKQSCSSQYFSHKFVSFLYSNKLYLILRVFYFYTGGRDYDLEIYRTKEEELFASYWKEQHDIAKEHSPKGQIKDDLKLSVSSSNLTCAYVDLATYDDNDKYN
jgi:hypothetical protein